MTGDWKIRIEIPRVPPSGNELRRKFRHPHAYRKLRNTWEQEIACALDGARSVARAKLRDHAAQHGKVRLRVSVEHNRFYDPDNLITGLKPVLDSLVRLGFIAGDSLKYLLLLAPQQRKGKGRTILEISEERGEVKAVELA